MEVNSDHVVCDYIFKAVLFCQEAEAHHTHRMFFESTCGLSEGFGLCHAW